MRNIVKCKPTPNEIKFNKMLRKTKRLSSEELIAEGVEAFNKAANTPKKREHKRKVETQPEE